MPGPSPEPSSADPRESPEAAPRGSEVIEEPITERLTPGPSDDHPPRTRATHPHRGTPLLERPTDGRTTSPGTEGPEEPTTERLLLAPRPGPTNDLPVHPEGTRPHRGRPLLGRSLDRRHENRRAASHTPECLEEPTTERLSLSPRPGPCGDRVPHDARRETIGHRPITRPRARPRKEHRRETPSDLPTPERPSPSPGRGPTNGHPTRPRPREGGEAALHSREGLDAATERLAFAPTRATPGDHTVGGLPPSPGPRPSTGEKSRTAPPSEAYEGGDPAPSPEEISTGEADPAEGHSLAPDGAEPRHEGHRGKDPRRDPAEETGTRLSEELPSPSADRPPDVSPDRSLPGYTELLPDEPGSLLDRLTRGRFGELAPPRRSVTVLLVLGAVAVLIAFLTLRETPREVPELEPVSQASAEELEAVSEGGSPSTAPEPEGEVVVHVGGEVAEPGLYTMPAGSRVADAVEEAGGARADTDLDLLNLARPLADGERILVGVEEEHTVDGASGEAGGPIDINRAGETELRTLPGIGEKRARQILAHREALGGSFGSVDDLLGVEGIAERTLENLRPHVTAG